MTRKNYYQNIKEKEWDDYVEWMSEKKYQKQTSFKEYPKQNPFNETLAL